MSIKKGQTPVLAEYSKIRIASQAGNGRDAIEAAQRLRPDTVILDIRLPDQSGIRRGSLRVFLRESLTVLAVRPRHRHSAAGGAQLRAGTRPAQPPFSADTR